MTTNTLAHQDSLDILLDRLPSDPNARGKEFEKVAQWFLKKDPEYSQKFRKVWRWSEWPKRWGADIGIDLVAETQDGKLWAIQVKGYDPENQVPLAFQANSRRRAKPGLALLSATPSRLSRKPNRKGKRT